MLENLDRGVFMAKQKPKMEFRYYTMPEKELVLALTGDEWIQEYGKDIDYLHFHNFMEVGICYYGSGEVVLGDEYYHFCDNSYVIIPPNFPHTTNADEGTKAYWEWMYFDMDSMIEDAMKTESMGVRSRVRKELYRKAFFLRGEEHPQMEAVIKLILREISEKKSFYRRSIRGYLTAFVAEMLRLYENEAEDTQTKHGYMVIAPAIEYAEMYYSQDVKISDMADACSLSESHFRRNFQEYMHMRPLDYLNLVRVEKACDMLTKSNASMEEVAYRNGFGNVSTFNRNFKKIIGVTPYQYKRTSDNYESKLLNYKISAKKGW